MSKLSFLKVELILAVLSYPDKLTNPAVLVQENAFYDFLLQKVIKSVFLYSSFAKKWRAKIDLISLLLHKFS